MRIGRIRGIHLAVGGRSGQVLRQLSARRIDAGLHVLGRGIDVAIQVELQGDVALTREIGRGHLRQAGDLGELVLERSRHRGRHGLGTRARQLCRDLDGREVHLRQRCHRQQRIHHAARPGKCPPSAGKWRSAGGRRARRCSRGVPAAGRRRRTVAARRGLGGRARMHVHARLQAILVAGDHALARAQASADDGQAAAAVARPAADAPRRWSRP